MFTRILLGLLVALPFAMQSGSSIQPLDVKLGLWETTVTTTMTGLPTIPDSALAQMPPDQRAKIEQMIQERNGKPTTTKSCLTKDKLQNTNPFQKAPPGCTYTVLSSTGSKMEVKMECTRNGMTMAGNVVVNASDSENVKGTVHMNATSSTGESGAMKMDSSFTSKWVAAACGDVQ
jgi:Protein of unknown function (DUF3617)